MGADETQCYIEAVLLDASRASKCGRKGVSNRSTKQDVKDFFVSAIDDDSNVTAVRHKCAYMSFAVRYLSDEY